MKQLTFRGVDVYLREPSYEDCLKKKSHRARENTCITIDDERVKLPCLEWGNGSVVFQFLWDELLYDNLVLFWESEYEDKGEDFNVELYKHEGNVIEWRVMLNKPYYEARRKRFESVLEDINGNVSLAAETLPESFLECVELIYLSDWDYLEYGELED